ncbi:MAG: hypothetical protein IKA17_10045 [Clostridia bacterium]|nr:hypothetical protein [Clostridia bacterium]
MKNKIISFILTLAILTGIFGTLSLSASAANDSVSVYIDGELIPFDVEPEIINGRTMVPMRKIFEYLGADVTWYSSSRKIWATCGYLRIILQVDNKNMFINDNSIELDSPPVIKDGRTLVPLRAVAEAFSAKVKWESSERKVNIETPYPKSDYMYDEKFDKYHITTSYGDFEYFDLLIEDDVLTVTGYSQDKSIEEVAIKFNNGLLDNITSVKPNKEFELSVDLTEQIPSDEAVLSVYTKKENDDFFWSYIYGTVFIEKNKNKYSFKKPLVWENNKDYMTKWENPIAYINPDIDAEIVALSNKICKKADNDYEKILLIHDWVADNIYYDFDYYYNRDSADISLDALSVYQSKRSVCEGYANLTQALINAQGIPCRKVSGYSLGLSSNLRYWTEETANKEISNHAWNQAYVDNRWINIDATWDSGNKYENGEFLYEGIENHLYFDISDVFFSYNHKYIR